ncbi:MAG TPA: rhomboid family intramembrane serine protease [Candidatus Binatia bacterium]|nr:rhomboid family intramembrane serine protease [Candidatus Binatia bacterium]
MNLNHILLFLAIVSPLLVLARAWQPSAPYHGWRLAAIVVLAVTALTWAFWRDASGYIGGAAWFLLLFLPAITLRKVTELAAQRDYESAAKLGAAIQIFHPTAELREQVRLFRQLNSTAPRPRAFSSVRTDYAIARSNRRFHLRSATAVFILIVANLIAFLFQISVGDWSDPEILHRIGALEPDAVVAQGEYWRLFTALFLHGGFLHLAFNLFALYVLGPPLERSIGTIRFLACYLISGLASSAGVVALTEIGLVQVGQLIGASGCIMGVVGAWAGFLLRHHHAPFAKQRLANIGLIVVIQIAFDLSTPQVSMASHLCGLVAGFFLGLILAPRPVAGGVDPGRTY